jgi:hypothetical protein
MSDAQAGGTETDAVEVSISIDGGRTVIDVTGERNVAFVVRSSSGEQIYLPPEDFEEEPAARVTPYESPYHAASGAQDTPYRPAEQSTPYRPADDSVQSPYDASDPPSSGLQSTSTGVRIVHPEPVSDVRLLR